MTEKEYALDLIKACLEIASSTKWMSLRDLISAVDNLIEVLKKTQETKT